MGRPYKLSFKDHKRLIELKAAGDDAFSLAVKYRVQLHTVYRYLKLDPFTRHDAPKR